MKSIHIKTVLGTVAMALFLGACEDIWTKHRAVLIHRVF